MLVEGKGPASCLRRRMGSKCARELLKAARRDMRASESPGHGMKRA